VPFCGLAVLEALSGERSAVRDPYLEEGQLLGYQALQPMQRQVVDRAAQMLEGDSPEGEAVRAIEQVLAGFQDTQRRSILERLLSST